MLELKAGCYMEAKLFGFWALTGSRGKQEVETAKEPEEGRAYGDLKAQTPGKGWGEENWMKMGTGTASGSGCIRRRRCRATRKWRR
jgi:hypothetical protein